MEMWKDQKFSLCQKRADGLVPMVSQKRTTSSHIESGTPNQDQRDFFQDLILQFAKKACKISFVAIFFSFF